jgi:hypothetical protein
MALPASMPISAEWLLFAALALCALGPLLLRRRVPLWVRVLAVCAALGAVAGARAWETRRSARLAREAAWMAKVPPETRRDEYVSSDQCRSCHPDQYASWHRSYHRTMTQYATPEAVQAPFDQVTLEARGEIYKLEQRGDEFWVEMPDPDWKTREQRRRRLRDWSSLTNAPRTTRRVSMVTGSHHLQKFWVPGNSGNLQFDLPFTYLVHDRRWVLREDSIIRDPELPLLLQLWNMNCIKCHTTAPQPRIDPDSGRPNSHSVELGISCEACHGPGSQHVAAHAAPLPRYAAHVASNAAATVVNPARLDHRHSSQVCGQCHGMKVPIDEDWEQHGFRYRPGHDLEKSTLLVLPSRRSNVPAFDAAMKESEYLQHWFWSDGMLRITGREYNALALTACHTQGQMSCLSCHSIHQGDRDQHLVPAMRSNEACLQCHQSYRDKLQAHTHHAPASAGSLCYNCHMPHTSWGLMKGIRSHQITSPTVQSTVATGRPNACNLCHLDQTLAWAGEHLRAWYQTPVPKLSPEQRHTATGVLWMLKGEAGQRALSAWALGWEPARVASSNAWAGPLLAHLLDDPYAAVRYQAHRALTQLPGFSDFRYDYVGPAPERARAKQTALESWNRHVGSTFSNAEPRLLLGPGGVVDRQRFDELLRQRDNRSVFLIE